MQKYKNCIIWGSITHYPTKLLLNCSCLFFPFSYRLFGATGVCSQCMKAIPPLEMVMRAREHIYHLDCFACQVCHYRFCVGDKFFLHFNLVLCEADYYDVTSFFNQLPYYMWSLEETNQLVQNYCRNVWVWHLGRQILFIIHRLRQYSCSHHDNCWLKDGPSFCYCAYILRISEWTEELGFLKDGAY